MHLSIGSIIIDDIVLPDGTTHMGVFGGGSTHAIAGMRVWSDSVGIVAWVGRDFPESMEAQLRTDFDLRGVIRRDVPSPRAWQLFETDGKRTEIFRTDAQEFADYSPKASEFPANLGAVEGVHLQCNFRHIPEWVSVMNAKRILWEPWGEHCTPENRATFRDVLQQVDAFSPNLLEARQLTGLNDPRDIARALLDDGAKVVALRMGAEGSLIADQNGVMAAVPAARVSKVVDVTGAGNAYCGGFVVSWAETGQVLEAACRGAVSASFALEQFGALYSFEQIRERAEQRLEILKRQL